MKGKEVLEFMANCFVPQEAEGWDKVVSFRLSGEGGGEWYFTIKDQKCTLSEGAHQSPDVTIICDRELWWQIVSGEVTVHTSFIQGRWRAEGDFTVLPHLHRLFPQPKPAENIFEQAEEDERSSSEGMLKLQRQRLEQMVNFAVEKSPFYRQLYRDVDLKKFKLEDLPIINSQIVMDNFDNLVTRKEITLKEIKQFLSDESTIGERYKDEFYVIVPNNDMRYTGKNGIFVYDRKSWGLIVVREMRGIKKFQALSLGTGEEKALKMANINSNLRNTTAVRLTDADCVSFAIVKSITFPYRQPLRELVKQLNVFQPNILCIYMKEIMELSLEQIKGNLRISPEMIIYLHEPPDQIFFTDVPKTKSLRPDRDLIYEAFGNEVEIFERLIPPPTTVIAWECDAHEGLHLNIDSFVLEFVDKENNPVPPGKKANKIIMSNLVNTTQPIIRYEMEIDCYIKPEKCSCGAEHPLMELCHRNDCP